MIRSLHIGAKGCAGGAIWVREVVREGCYQRPWLIRPGLARPVGHIHTAPNECRVVAQDHQFKFSVWVCLVYSPSCPQLTHVEASAV